MKAQGGKSKFKKGKAKTGGRQKGGRNKKTLILDSFAKDIVEGGMQKFQRELNKMKGANFVKAYMTLFEYVKPKLAKVENNVKNTGVQKLIIEKKIIGE